MKIRIQIILIFTGYSLNVMAQNFWENKGLNGNAVYDISVDGLGNVYAATSDSGVYFSNNNGNDWQQRNVGLTSLNIWSVEALENPAGYIFAGTVEMGLFKSSDMGNNWTHSGLNEWVSEITSSGNGYIFISTITDGIYRSTDTGNNWQKISDSMQIGRDVYSIAVNSGDDIFAGTDAYIFRSEDYGNTWTKVDTGLIITGVIWSITFNSAGDVFCGDGGGFFVGTGSVYRSSDNGNNWSQTFITSRSVIALITISASTIYAGTDSGAYVSYDNGETGEQINSGLTESIVYSLALNRDGYLFAGTNNGIFRSVESVTSIGEIPRYDPSMFILIQNYPNPFNPTTTIKYSIPKASNVVIKVFDILGNEIETLVNKEKPAGTYELTWNAANLPSGVYFYQLRAGDFIQTKKMILLK